MTGYARRLATALVVLFMITAPAGGSVAASTTGASGSAAASLGPASTAPVAPNVQADQIINATDSVGIWQGAVLTLRADESAGAIQLDNANWNIEAAQLNNINQDLNKDPIAVYDSGTTITLDFDNNRGGDNQALLDTQVQLIAARLEGNQSATLSSVSTLSGLKDLVDTEAANDNATFELADTDTLDSGGDGTFTYTPSQPGQYVLFLATNGTNQGFAVDGSGNISLVGDTTVVGADHVAVQRGSSTVTTAQPTYAAGDDVTFEIDTQTDTVVQTGGGVTHAVILYDEKTFVNETFNVKIDGEVTSDFNVSENVTLEHSIARVNGVGENVNNASAFGVDVEAGRATGLVTFQSILDYVAENTSVSDSLLPKDSVTGDTVWNASMTVKNGSADDTVVVETRSNWPSGEFRWVHLATDANGTEFAADTGTIDLDAAAQPANVGYSNLAVSPADGATVNVTEQARGTLDVANTGGLAGNYDVTLYVDGTAVDWANGSIGAGESISPTLTHTFTSAGTFNVTLAADGQSATSNITVVVPDTTPPSISLHAPTEGKVTYATPVQVNVSADAVTAYATVNGTVRNLTAQSNPRVITTTGIPEGSQTITVNATDDAGNEAQRSFTFDFASDPTIDSVSPAAGSTVGTDSPWINATFSDQRHGANESGIDPTATTLRIDGGPVDISGAAVKNDSQLRYRTSGLAEGQHTARLAVADNESHTTARTWKFSVDSAAPSVSIASSRSVVSAKRPTTVSVTANDDNLASAKVRVINTSGNQGVIRDVTATATTTSGTISFSYAGGSLDDGEYNLTIVASDTNGNNAIANASIRIDNTAPTTSSESISNASVTATGAGQSVLTNGPANFTFDATDDTTLTGAYSVRRKSTGAATGVTGSFTNGTKRAISLGSLATGQYQVRVTVTDQGGNQLVRTIPPHIVLDRTPPGLSTVVTSNGSGGLWVNVTASETLQGAPSGYIANQSASLNDTISFTEGGKQTTYNGTVAQPPGGIYNVTVAGTDLAGNRGSDTSEASFESITRGANTQVTVINERTGTFLLINLSVGVSNELVTLSGSDQTAFSLPPGQAAERFENLEFNDSAIENVTIGVRAKPGNKPTWASNNDLTLRFWNTSTKSWTVITATEFRASYDIPAYDGASDNQSYWIAPEQPHLSQWGVVANDTAPPSIDFVEPSSEGQTYDADTETVEVDVDLTDDETGINESTIQLLVNDSDETGNANIVNESGGNYSLTFNVTGLSPGDSRNVTIVAEDFAGNRTVGIRNFSIASDNTAPTVTFDFPTEDQTLAVGTQNVTLNVTYGDGTGASSSGIDTANVTVAKNGTDVTDAATVNDTTLNVTATGLAAGGHNFTVRVPDRAGNWANETVNFTIDADTAAPIITIDDVNGGNPLANTTTATTIDATVNDTGLGVDDSTVQVYFNDVEVTSDDDTTISDPVGGNLTVSYDADVSYGNAYNLTIVANDTADNRNSSEELFTVADDTGEPTLTIESPTDGGVANTTVSSNDTATATINVTLADDVSGIDTSGTSLVFNGSTVTGSATITTGGVVYTTGALSPGTYSYNVTTRDNASNTNSTTGSFDIDVDGTDPTASLSGPGSADTGSSVTFDASGSTDNGAIDTYEFAWGDGSANTTTTHPTASASHTYSSAGTYTVTVVVTDKAGNTANATRSITVSEPETTTGGGGGGGGGGGAPAVVGSGNVQVTRSISGGVTTIQIRGATQGSSVSISVSQNQVTREVQTRGSALESLEVDFSGETAFDLQLSGSATKPDPAIPDPPSDRGAIGYISVDHDASDDAVGEVRFTFQVTREQLNQRGVDRGEVTLYRYSDGQWTALETEFLDATDGVLRFRSTSPGLSVFAIGSRQVTTTTTAPPTTTTTTTTTETTTAPGTTTTTAPGTTTGPTTTSPVEEPAGFDWTPFVVVGVIVLVALGYLYYRRRER